MTVPLPPLVPADPEVPVEVWDDRARDWYPGFVTHWRGGRVAVPVQPWGRGAAPGVGAGGRGAEGLSTAKTPRPSR